MAAALSDSAVLYREAVILQKFTYFMEPVYLTVLPPPSIGYWEFGEGRARGPSALTWPPADESDPGFPSTENTFCSGDHVSWHSPLDNSESRIQHMLLTEDAQLQPVHTPFGLITFLQVSVLGETRAPELPALLPPSPDGPVLRLSFRQIVGICAEELQAAQQWNGQGLLELLRSVRL